MACFILNHFLITHAVQTTWLCYWSFYLWLFPLSHISCSDTKLLEMMGFSIAVFTLMFTVVLIILSYPYIIRTILRIRGHRPFHMSFPHDCHLHLLCQLHFHVHESISKGQGVFEQLSGSAKHLSNPHAEPLYLYPKEFESQVSLHGHEDCTLLRKWKNKSLVL